MKIYTTMTTLHKMMVVNGEEGVFFQSFDFELKHGSELVHDKDTRANFVDEEVKRILNW